MGELECSEARKRNNAYFKEEDRIQSTGERSKTLLFSL